MLGGLKRLVRQLPGGIYLRKAWYGLRHLPESLSERLAPAAHYERRKKNWSSKWARNDFAPPWMTEEVPPELRQALDSGWFRAGSSLLDIGCGDGRIAYWLARSGFNVYGFDFAAPAIEKAKREYGETRRLEFAVQDVTRMSAPPRQFELLFDRGCFHIIPKAYRGDYAKGIAPWAAPGARFLLLCAITKGPDDLSKEDFVAEERAIDEVRLLLQPYFEVENITRTLMHREFGSRKLAPLRSIAVRLVRRRD